MSGSDQLAPPPTRRRWLRTAALLSSALLIGLYLLLPLLSSTDPIRRRIEGAAAAATGRDVHIDHVRIGYDLGLHLSGLSAAGTGAPPFLTVAHAAAYLSPRGLLSGQPFTVTLTAPRIFVDRLPASTDQGGPLSLPSWRLHIEDGYFVTAANGEIGPITVSVDGFRAQQQVHASMRIDTRLPPLDVVTTIDTTADTLRFASLQLDWRNVPLSVLAERFPFITSAGLDGTLDLSASASGTIQQLEGSGSLRVQGLRYRTDSVALAGDIDAPFTVRGSRVVLGDPGLRVAGPMWSAAGLSGSAKEATLAGTIERDGGGVRTKGKFTIDTIQGHDPSSERVIEGVAVTGTLDGHWGAAAASGVTVTLSAASGELLWYRFYADMRRHPVTLGCQIGRSAQGIAVTNIDARAKDIGRLKGNVTVAATAAIDSVAAQIEVPDLAGLYGLAVRDAYKESYPVLASITTGGSLSAQLDYTRAGADFTVDGTLRLANAAISSTDPIFDVRGLSLDLPLQLGAVRRRAPQAGQLAIGTMRFGDIAVGEVAAALRVSADTIELAQPLSVAVLGGTMQIDELALEQIATPQRRARFGVTGRGLNLDELTTTMGLPPFHGTLSAAIPRVTVTASDIRSAGEIRARAFDGDITVRNLSVDQLFSSVPTVGFDMDFEDISLSRLTDTLAVGRISGVAHGAAGNLKIVNGEPSSFDAWMETVERPGVPQRVSVAAIRQLSILGGSGGDPFSQGVLGFFDEYRYARMGFKCRLENDRFLLRGVETKDGREYLVVGSRLPPRVNVVSHTQVISFSEMVRRLQRVTTATPPQEKKGEPQ